VTLNGPALVMIGRVLADVAIYITDPIFFKRPLSQRSAARLS
jgi:hypothetical protein